MPRLVQTSPSPALARMALSRLGEKWTASVLRVLAGHPRQYGIIRRELGISAKVLTVTLRGLQRDGFVARSESPSAGLQVNYDLTPLGRALLSLLDDVEAWASQQEQSAPIAAEERTGIRARHPSIPTTERDDTDQQIETVPTHLCVAVHDLDHAAGEFSRLFGVEARPAERGTVTAPNHHQGEIARRAFPVANFCFEFIQPIGGSSAFQDFLKRSGQGIHHIGLRTRGDIEEHIARFERHGGRRTMGGVDERYALFDFSDQFGSTLEVVSPDIDSPATRITPRFHHPNALAHFSLSHIGILVRDVHDAAAQYAETVGVAISPLRMVTPEFPAGTAIDAKSRAHVVHFRQGNIAIMLIEPVGPSPWRELVEERGNAVHHVAFNVGDTLNDTINRLKRLGAKQVLGRPGVGYAQFDFTREFGLVVGLTGRSIVAGRR